ncbi:MAG: ABC transporter permease [Ktedonobacteraceae bacterium]
MKQMRPWLLSWETLLIALLVVVASVGTSLSPYFLTGSNLSLMTQDIMEKAIMALPMTLIIVAGEIDLSVASMLGLSSVIVGVTWKAGLPLGLGISIALVVGVLGGFINGLFVTRLGLPSLVVTLGTLALYRGLAYVVIGNLAVSNFPDWFTNFGIGTLPGTLIPWSFLLFLILAIVFVVILHRSWIGRQIYAIGNNQEAARFAGIGVARIKLWLFIISGLLSALAGAIFTARFANARADNALGFELDVVTIVLLGGVNIFGGRGSLIGVMLSLFVIGTVRNALGLADLASEIQSIVAGALLVFSVLGPNIARRIQVVMSRRQTSASSLK